MYPCKMILSLRKSVTENFFPSVIFIGSLVEDNASVLPISSRRELASSSLPNQSIPTEIGLFENLQKLCLSKLLLLYNR